MSASVEPVRGVWRRVPFRGLSVAVQPTWEYARPADDLAEPRVDLEDATLEVGLSVAGLPDDGAMSLLDPIAVLPRLRVGMRRWLLAADARTSAYPAVRSTVAAVVASAVA